MKKKLLLLSSALMSLNVMAVSLEFKFDINSSGPSMYACNAGIRHDAHEDRICYDRGTGQSCNPADTCLSDEECNCVCTGSTSGDGEHRLDFVTVSSSLWTDNGDIAGPSTNKNVHATNGNYNIAFDESNGDEWKRQITGMSVNLGSERYGAQFFLDVCYRGPQIEYWGAQNGAGSEDDFTPSPYATPNFALKTQATITDIKTADGRKYSDLSDLKVKSEVICDLQGKGSKKYAGPYDTVETDIYGGFNVPGDEFKTSSGSNWRSFNTNQASYLIDSWVTNGTAFTPRFCKARYTFLENRRNDTGNHSDLKKHLRKWKLQKAQVCTFTEINEAI